MSAPKSTEVCLRELAAAQPASFRAIAKLCGVTANTALRWYEGENLPKGTELLKLRVALTLLGFKPKEREELGVASRDLGDVIAYDVMSTEEVKNRLGYSDVTGVQSIVLRGTGVMPDKAFKIEELVRSTEADREAGRSLWYSILEAEGATPLGNEDRPQPPAATTVAPAPRPHREDSGVAMGGISRVISARHDAERRVKPAILLMQALDDLLADLDAPELRRAVTLGAGSATLDRLRTWLAGD